MPATSHIGAYLSPSPLEGEGRVGGRSAHGADVIGGRGSAALPPTFILPLKGGGDLDAEC